MAGTTEVTVENAAARENGRSGERLAETRVHSNSALKKPLLVSFSGLDGSGKSTQISALREYLESSGLRTITLAFWDDIVVGKGWREGFVHKVYKSEKGIGAPGKPVERRDKNVRKWYLTIARQFLYLMDSVSLCLVVGKARSAADVVIMDRYIYDELANLPLSNPLTKLFVRAVNALVPRPDIAYLLDVDVEAARARKPEYPVDFMKQSQVAYFKLAEMLGTMTVIPALDLDESREAVIAAARCVITNNDRKLAVT